MYVDLYFRYVWVVDFIIFIYLEIIFLVSIMCILGVYDSFVNKIDEVFFFCEIRE